MISIDILRKLFTYDPASGYLFWNTRDEEMFSSGGPRRTRANVCACWNNRYAGTRAGKVSGRGYVYVSVCGEIVAAHRVAFAMQTGEWPKECIDHINGNRSDNRFCNLREATRSQNAENICLPRHNSSGLIGASFSPRHRKWKATIRKDRRCYFLGYFDTPQDAHGAYVMAKHTLHKFQPNIREG